MNSEALQPILDAAESSVRYHQERSDVEYPGYIWIEWDDLVRFVGAGGIADER